MVSLLFRGCVAVRKIEPIFPMLHEAITLGLIWGLEDHQALLDARRSSIAYAPAWVSIPAPHPGLDGVYGLFDEVFRGDVRFFIANLNIVPVSQI